MIIRFRSQNGVTAKRHEVLWALRDGLFGVFPTCSVDTPMRHRIDSNEKLGLSV